MQSVSIITNLKDHPQPELSAFLATESPFLEIEQIARQPDATETGKPAVIIKLRHPNGSISYARTTQALYMGAASAFKGAQERDDHIAATGQEMPPPKCNMLRSMLQLPCPRTCVLCQLGPCHNVKPEGK